MKVHVDGGGNHGSVTLLTGITDDGKRRVWFGADARIAATIQEEADRTDEPVPCEVEGWQILRTEPVEVTA